MNANDITRLEELNERYTPVNLTGFKLVGQDTDKSTVLKHFETDLKILSTSGAENKKVVRVILEEDVIDICSFDNGTPVSYFFCEDARFTPDDIEEDIEELCNIYDVTFKDFRG